MNTQIQRGLEKPYGNHSLAKTVGASLLASDSPWTGIVWRPSLVQLAHESNERASKQKYSSKIGHIFGRHSGTEAT